MQCIKHTVFAGSDTTAAALYAISDFIVHPDYVLKTLENDIAVVKTVKQIRFSRDVGPVCLPFKYASYDYTEADVTVLGNIISYGSACKRQLHDF